MICFGLRFFVFLLILVCVLPGAGVADEAPPPTLSSLSVSGCIDIALERNRKRLISKLAVETAEHQFKQALSAYWPQVNVTAAYKQQDEDVNFILPENTYAFNLNLPGLGPLAGQTTVPEQEVTVMDRESIVSSLDITYPLFTGGLRSSMAKAAKSNIKAAKEAMRRTELELIRDVQRMYYGVVLAQRLADIGTETLIRLETTTGLTERLYKKGSGSVTKLDYLRSKMVLESARSIVERLVANVPLAEAALGNTMGLAWNKNFTLVEKSIPFVPVKTDLNQLVTGVYQFNPDWKQLAAGLDAAQAMVNKERAGHWPKVALSGSLWRWDNNLDGQGMATEENEEGWRVGIGVKMPLFSGFLTTHAVREAKARVKRLESQKILLREGLALKVKHGVIRLDRSQKIRDAAMKAVGFAREHRELAVRAYMNDLISTEKVIESQIFEALACARFEASQFENVNARFDIEMTIGKEIRNLLRADG